MARQMVVGGLRCPTGLVAGSRVGGVVIPRERATEESLLVDERFLAALGMTDGGRLIPLPDAMA
ncbi:MAG: hypothetical protein Fur005_08450 [Roseiflexaceae bacterium]